MILSLSSINFLERLTELRETYYSLYCWFIVKGFNSAQPDGSHARGSAWREGSELSHPLIEPHCLDLHVLTRPGNSPYPLLWGFSGSYIALARLIKSLSLMTEINLQLLSSPKSLRVGLGAEVGRQKVLTPYSRAWFTWKPVTVLVT